MKIINYSILACCMVVFVSFHLAKASGYTQVECDLTANPYPGYPTSDCKLQSGWVNDPTVTDCASTTAGSFKENLNQCGWIADLDLFVIHPACGSFQANQNANE